MLCNAYILLCKMYALQRLRLRRQWWQSHNCSFATNQKLTISYFKWLISITNTRSMFFFNSNFNFIKTNFFTKINLARIQTFLLTISGFESDKNHGAEGTIFLRKHAFSMATPAQLILDPLNFDPNLIESLLESLSFFLLLLTVFIYWFETAFRSKAKKQKFGSLMVKLSNLSLTFLLGTRWITSHHFPLSNLYESLIFLSWSLTVIHFILEKISHTLLIGVLLSPITLFINGFALFTLPIEMQRGNFLTPALQSNWLMMHVTVMISSYAALLSGSILAIAFLVITRDTTKNNNAQTTIIAEQKFPNFILQNKNDRLFLESKSKQLTLDSKFLRNRSEINLPQANESKINCDFVANALQSKDLPQANENQVSTVSLAENVSRKTKNLFFNKILKKNYNNLLFVEKNQQLLPNSELSLKETSFSRNQNNLSSPFFEEKQFLQYASQESAKHDLAKTLDNLSYRTIGIGFPLLTIGILSGAVWANEAWGSYWSWDPKETWALITWFLFAIYLHARITKGLQGEKPAIIATLGFIVVWICFLGVNLASQGLHTYGWLQ